jgi:hypothetical protein
VTALRQKMTDELLRRNYSEGTAPAYLRFFHVKTLRKAWSVEDTPYLRPRYRSTGVRYSRLCCGRGGLPDARPPLIWRRYGFRTAVQWPSTTSLTLMRPLTASPSIQPARNVGVILGFSGFPHSASKLSSM